MKKHVHFFVIAAFVAFTLTSLKPAFATNGTGLVSVTATGGSCLGFTPAVGAGPDNWEVAEGGSYTMTITGVTECSGSEITVFIQSSSSGNFCFTATGGSGTYVGNFTIPNPTCATMPISYKCGGNQPCDNADTYNANGPSDNHKIHLRASHFDGNCIKTETDEDCSGSPQCTISVSGADNDVTCHGDNDGSIDITVTGAQGEVSYSWSDGSTASDRSGLAPGSYTLTVSDEGGCEDTETFDISEPDALDVNGLAVNVTVTNGSDGPIDISVTGGTPPYSFLWNDGAITEDRFNLPAGTYTVTVTDDHNCIKGGTFTIDQPECELSVSGLTVDATCHGNKDGSIDITVSGAQGNVTYLWSDGSTAGDRSGLELGTYSVTVSDDGGCEDMKTFTINAPAAVKAKITTIANNGSCQAPCLQLSTPYKANYTYKWKLNGQVAPGPHSSNTYCACISGSYQVKVTNTTTGCAHTAKPYIVNITQKLESDQLNDAKGGLFSAWPNPTQDNVNITVANRLEGNVQVQLVDLVGRIIHSEVMNGLDQNATITFSVNDLPSGMYIVRLLNGENRDEQKIMVNN